MLRITIAGLSTGFIVVLDDNGNVLSDEVSAKTAEDIVSVSFHFELERDACGLLPRPVTRRKTVSPTKTFFCSRSGRSQDLSWFGCRGNLSCRSQY